MVSTKLTIYASNIKKQKMNYKFLDFSPKGVQKRLSSVITHSMSLIYMHHNHHCKIVIHFLTPLVVRLPRPSYRKSHPVNREGIPKIGSPHIVFFPNELFI